jgi:lipopolysaccharide export system protein LptA
MSFIRTLILMTALAGLTAPALAQIGGQGGPMDISADRLETFDTERRAVFSGNVDAAQGEANLRSDRLEVFFARRSGNAESTGASWGEVERVIATGDVFYVTPEEVARGEQAVYELTTETIVMTGGVTLTRGRDVITGSCLIVDLETNNSQINAPGCMGGSAGATPSTSSSDRVRFIAFPAGNDDEDEDADTEDTVTDAEG